MKVSVNGKINIGLKVTGESGGLHTLDGLFHSIGLCDEFDFSHKGIKVNDETGETDCVRYGKYLSIMADKFGIDGIEVVKRVPLGGGLGGGTTALVAIATYLEIARKQKITDEFLLSLGSDVPFMYKGGFARVRGFGEKADFYPPINYFALLVKSGEVSTGEAYKRLGEKGKLQFSIDDIFENLVMGKENFTAHNDLFSAACELNRDVEILYDKLNRYGLPCFMSGSGATIVALSKSKKKLTEISEEFSGEKNCEKFFQKIVGFEKTGKSVN